MKNLSDIKAIIDNILGITDITNALNEIAGSKDVNTYLKDEINLEYRERIAREFSFLPAFTFNKECLLLKYQYRPVEFKEILDTYSIFLDGEEILEINSQVNNAVEYITNSTNVTINKPTVAIGSIPVFKTMKLVDQDNLQVGSVNSDLELIDSNGNVIGNIEITDNSWYIKSHNITGTFTAIYKSIRVNKITRWANDKDGLIFNAASNENTLINIEASWRPAILDNDTDATVLPISEMDIYLAYSVASNISHRLLNGTGIQAINEKMNELRTRINEVLL